MTKKNQLCLFVILAGMIPSVAHADAGLLPFVVFWPILLLALIPIVLVEEAFAGDAPRFTPKMEFRLGRNRIVIKEVAHERPD